MQLSRRSVVGLAAGGAVLGGLGGGASVVGGWWQVPAGAGFAVLSEDEAAVVRAWAGAAFPPGAACPVDGATAGLDRFFDGVLAGLPPLQRDLLKLLLHAIDTGAIALEGARFTALPPAAARRAFHALVEAELAEVRGAALSLTVLLGTGYTVHPGTVATLSRLHLCGLGA